MSRRGTYHSYEYLPACPDTPMIQNQFHLQMRQQPIQARISTNNEKDRRVIDPPPIIQIRPKITTLPFSQNFLQNAYVFMCANLAHPTNDDEIYTPNHNALSGQTVSSMYRLKDVDNHDGGFFIFGDLSVKVEGRFRLKFSVFEITHTGAVCLESLFSEPFIVYSARAFPGVLESTFLSRSFSDQGARIRIRKENRNRCVTTSQCLKRRLSAASDDHDLQRRHLLPQPVSQMPAQPMQTQSMPTPLHLRTDNIPCANSGWHATTSPPSTTPVPMIAKKEASPVMHPERRDSLGSTETDSTCDDHSPRSTHFSLSAFRLAKPVTPTLSLETPCPVYTCTDRPFASYGQDHGLLFSPLPKQMHSSPVSMPTAPPPSLFSSVNEVRLPPLRHILNNQEKPVEHDAAAAMIQLAKPTHAPFAEDMFHQRKLVPFSQLSCSSKPSSPGVMVFH